MKAFENEVKVGMGATMVLWTDREPFTVIEVKSRTRIVVQEDDYKVIEGSMADGSAEYELFPNPNGRKLELILTKRGWKVLKERTRFVVGVRRKYYDPSF